MKTIFDLFRKDWITFVADRIALMLTFLVPFVMLFLFGQIFSGGGGGGGIRKVPIAVVFNGEDSAMESFITALDEDDAFRVRRTYEGSEGETLPLTEERVREDMRLNRYRYAFVITEAEEGSEAILGYRIQYLYNPRNQMENAVVNGLAQRTLIMQAPTFLMRLLREQGEKEIGVEKMDGYYESMADAISDTFGDDREEVLQIMRGEKTMEFSSLFEAGDGNGDGELIMQVQTFLMRVLREQGEKEVGVEKMDRYYESIADAISVTFGDDREEVLQIMRGDKAVEFSPLFESGDGNGDGEGSGGSDGDGDFNMMEAFGLEREQVVGQQVKAQGPTRGIGGWAVNFLLFALGFSMADLYSEKQAGIFNRLFSAGVTPAHMLCSRFLFGVSLSLVQLLVLFLSGSLLFDVDVWSNLVNLAVVCLFVGMACTSYGMLITSLSQNYKQAGGFTPLFVLGACVLGGGWFPLSGAPDWIQLLSKLTPVYWSMEGFFAVLWSGNTLVETLPILGVLALITVVLMSVSLWRFYKGPLFR